jgi:hypothetical protein
MDGANSNTNLITALIGLASALTGAFTGGWFAYLTSLSTADKQHKFQASTYTFDYYRDKQKLFQENKKELGKMIGIILGSSISLESSFGSDNNTPENLNLKRKCYKMLGKSMYLMLSSFEDVRYVKKLFEEFKFTTTDADMYIKLQEYSNNQSSTHEEIEELRLSVSQYSYDDLIKRFTKTMKIYSFLEVCFEVIIIRFHKKLFIPWLKSFN